MSAAEDATAAFDRAWNDRVGALGSTMAGQLPALTDRLHEGLLAHIPELKSDPVLEDLLRSSVDANLETVAHLLQHDLDVEDATVPVAAREYSRRLAQRGVPLTALVRAYRLGQQWISDWAFQEIRDKEPDPDVAYRAIQEMITVTFRYIDRITEQVIAAYETERKKWLAHQNTVRTQLLEQLLAGEPIDAATAETTLGHRMRQQHVGAVLWAVDAATDALGDLERLAGTIAQEIGAVGSPFVAPRDRSTAWAWFPMGSTTTVPDLAAAVVEKAGSPVRVAFGAPAPGVAGFRATHDQALSATYVARLAGERGQSVTSYSANGVRAATLLASDLGGSRRLVADVLGDLGTADDGATRLRDTLLVFLDSGGSYLATAEQLHLHKNTVRYRVEKAVELRGRGLDVAPLELHLALLACHWLGDAVLTPA
ncbi:helix-turn-helix domain-containing protein [Nocardioides sp. WS12]|uniref:PucR family transcriptional regulator n=1 Tax=Nocardioides sp. WS12 TaxID=2486272 RepID=UPI001F466FBB|nr:helix-turn-helix domain-containing protein [Nocardioides sp. WS12]